MNQLTLQTAGVTTDPTLRQVLHGLQERGATGVVVFEEPARVFSAPPDGFNLVVFDEAAAGGNYLSLAKRARKRYPAVDIVVVGGPKSDEVRRSDQAQGVDYYYERPIDERALEAALLHRLALTRFRVEAGIVGRSDALIDILETILQVGPTEVPILVEGESGTGKDVIARAIHLSSARREAAYVPINCASLAEGVLESELFGHEKGAFTGAVGQRAGVFERAHGGTIFLDEVGEMSPGMQVRLLRVLETGEVLRVGGVRSFHVDVRVVAATNRNLTQGVASGTFRQDLYYRLKGVSLYIPPLRERKEDIPLLVDYFIHKASRRHKKNVSGIDADALRVVVDNPWPGNVRELRNVIDTAVVLSPSGRIARQQIDSQLSGQAVRSDPLLPMPLNRTREEAEREMLYASIFALHRDVRQILAVVSQGTTARPLEPMREVFPETPDGNPGPQSLATLERAAIAEALRASGGNRRKAAQALGISERTLYRKIKEFGLL